MSEVKRFIKAVVSAFPQTGSLHDIIAHNGNLYYLLEASYGFEGFIFKTRKGFICEAPGVPDLCIVAGEEEPTKRLKDESYEVELKGFKAESAYKVAKVYHVFTYKAEPRFRRGRGFTDEHEAANAQPDYYLVSLDQLVAVATFVLGIGEGKSYRYYSTPTWMYATIKRIKQMYPDLYCTVGIEGKRGKYRYIKVLRVLSVKIKRIKVKPKPAKPKISERTVTVSIEETDVEVEEEERREIEGRIKGLIETI